MATILLIDDDVDLVEMNRLVLTHRGHEVKAAYSAAEARQVLAGLKPDLVVLDVMMESSSAGFDLARDIHRQLPTVPTIMLTSVHAATGSSLRFKPDDDWLPVAQFVDKPIAPAALADKIDVMLRKPSSPAPQAPEK